MISDTEIDRVAAASAKFKPALIDARYHPDTDRMELVTPWCTLLVDRPPPLGYTSKALMSTSTRPDCSRISAGNSPGNPPSPSEPSLALPHRRSARRPLIIRREAQKTIPQRTRRDLERTRSHIGRCAAVASLAHPPCPLR